MMLSKREPSMSTLLIFIFSLTSTCRSFSVTTRSPGETCTDKIWMSPLKSNGNQGLLLPALLLMPICSGSALSTESQAHQLHDPLCPLMD